LITLPRGHESHDTIHTWVHKTVRKQIKETNCNT